MAHKNSKKARNRTSRQFPSAAHPEKIGEYDLLCKSGGGMLYKEVLEYRVWDHGTDGDDECYSFADYDEAQRFSDDGEEREPPLVLVLQNPWLTWNESKHDYELIYEDRIAEWQVKWLTDENKAKNAGSAIAKLRREKPDGWE